MYSKLWNFGLRSLHSRESGLYETVAALLLQSCKLTYLTLFWIGYLPCFHGHAWTLIRAWIIAFDSLRLYLPLWYSSQYPSDVHSMLWLLPKHMWLCLIPVLCIGSLCSWINCIPCFGSSPLCMQTSCIHTFGSSPLWLWICCIHSSGSSPLWLWICNIHLAAAHYDCTLAAYAALVPTLLGSRLAE